MRILVTGANGQLGHAVTRQLLREGWDVSARNRRQLDIAVSQQICDAFAAQRFDLVINTAAYTDVDGAETEKEESFRVNAEAPARLARVCASQAAVLIHLSTDYVFDGTGSTAYTEADPPCPANTYGAGKEAGERLIRELLDRHLIIRTAWLFSARGRNFVRTLLRLAAEREELNVVADQYGNPTAADDVASMIANLVRKLSRSRGNDFPWGTYHCVSQGAASWHGFAEAIVDEAAPLLGRRPVVRPIVTDEYPTPATRPQNSRLDCTKIEKAFGIVMPNWQHALPGVIRELISSGLQKSAGSMQ